MDKNKLTLIFPKIPMVIVFDETVLESWYGIFESFLSYGIDRPYISRFCEKREKTSNGFRSTKYSTKGVWDLEGFYCCRSHVGKQKVLTVLTLTGIYYCSINL